MDVVMGLVAYKVYGYRRKVLECSALFAYDSVDPPQLKKAVEVKTYCT
jgi:hypothetical protein